MYSQKAYHKDNEKKKRDHESSDESKEDQQLKSVATPVRKCNLLIFVDLQDLNELNSVLA